MLTNMLGIHNTEYESHFVFVLLLLSVAYLTIRRIYTVISNKIGLSQKKKGFSNAATGVLKSEANKQIARVYYDRTDDTLHKTLGDLKCRLLERGIELQLHHKITKYDKQFPWLFLCVNESRLGEDVKELVKHYSNMWKRAFLILHQKEKHTLKAKYSDSLEEQSKCEVFHMEFQKQIGLHDTDLNKASVDKICHFCILELEEA